MPAIVSKVAAPEREALQSYPEALLYEPLAGKPGKVRCNMCQWRCTISAGGYGVCRTRYNDGGKLYALNYAPCLQRDDQLRRSQAAADVDDVAGVLLPGLRWKGSPVLFIGIPDQKRHLVQLLGAGIPQARDAWRLIHKRTIS